MLIINAGARRTILSEARRLNISLASVSRKQGDTLHLDWEALVEAIEAKRNDSST